MRKIILAICLLSSFFSCQSKKKDEMSTDEKRYYVFDLQGHRGARGWAPENTIVAFRKALELGVNTMELDVVVSKDKQVVVSHEPWFNGTLTITPDGEDMLEDKKRTSNFYKMNYAEIKKYDCGSRKDSFFPEQQPAKAYKPLLKEVLQIIEKESKVKGKVLNYNIEIKSMPQGDNLFHPEPKEYCELVVSCIKEVLPTTQFNIQSFDFRILKELHQNYPEIVLSALVEKGEMDVHLEELGFIPEIYSPNFTLVDSMMLIKAHKKNMKVIPWTVNATDDMKKLLAIGVDGLITDYPDRALKFKKRVE